MASVSDTEKELILLQKQIKIARCEISNLRQRMRTFRYSHQKEIETLKLKLAEWKSGGCTSRLETDEKAKDPFAVSMTPIGVINSIFPKKRGTPRQTGMCSNSQGRLVLFKSVFSNPEHSIDGLADFSHMWILFHFDRNFSNHMHAKVSPPRLNGDRIGVFATRSPHRPCPIGLSLVRIDSIQGATIAFSGVDMVDGTPVFDIKPYIPHYDNPLKACLSLPEGNLDVKCPEITPGSPVVSSTLREAPDGEESDEDCLATISPFQDATSEDIRVPTWVKPGNQMNVELSSEAEQQLKDMDKFHLWPIILSVLREDPRSVYIKQRYLNQFFTFLIADLHVSCRFDDRAHSVSVYRISPAGTLCACGVLEWQCTTNHEPILC